MKWSLTSRQTSPYIPNGHAHGMSHLHAPTRQLVSSMYKCVSACRCRRPAASIALTPRFVDRWQIPILVYSNPALVYLSSRTPDARRPVNVARSVAVEYCGCDGRGTVSLCPI